MEKGKKIIRQWVETFNRGDSKELAEFYHFDAINHQVNQEPIIGKASIHEMFQREFAQAEMHCQIENLFEEGDWVILEWKDPLGLRGCGFFQLEEQKIKFQRGYWDRLSFLRMHKLPIPKE